MSAPAAFILIMCLGSVAAVLGIIAFGLIMAAAEADENNRSEP